jgi:hypothetical protein
VFLAAPLRLMREVLLGAITIVRGYVRLRARAHDTSKAFRAVARFQPKTNSPRSLTCVQSRLQGRIAVGPPAISTAS